MGWESRRAVVKELAQGKSGYSFLVGEADVGGRHSRFSGVLKLPSVLLGEGIRVDRLRAHSGKREVSVGSDNIGLGGQSSGGGAWSNTFLASTPDSADALFTSP